MKKSILILFLALIVSVLWAQKKTENSISVKKDSLSAKKDTLSAKKERNIWLHGRVCDSFTKAPVPKDGRASLLRGDSTIVQDTISLMERNSYMSGSRRTVSVDYGLIIHGPGRYIIKVEHPNYETAYVPYEVKHIGRRVQEIEGPPVYMKKAARAQHFEGGELGEVVVKATKVKMVWRGDTLVYNADAFNVPDGSMLDGLIKQLPGVELTEEGEIFVNGKKVENLTLNGADFFKGKNKMMLENLPYYTVKNVEVYKKQTEEQKYLGNNDDDRKEYTMDVVLKREYSIGATANMEAGYGTDDRYRLKGFGLRFTDHTRAVLFGGANNVNETIDFNDEGKDKGKTNQAGDRHFRQVGGMFMANGMEGRLQNNTEVRAEWKDDHAETRTLGESYLNNGSTYSQSQGTRRDMPASLSLSNQLRLRTKIFFNSWFNLDYDRQKSESENWSQTAADQLFSDSTNSVRGRSWNRQGRLLSSVQNSLAFKLPSGDNIDFSLSGNYQRSFNPVSESWNHYIYYNLGTTDFQHRRTESPSYSYRLNARLSYNMHLTEHFYVSPYYGISPSRNNSDQLEFLTASDSLSLLPDLDNTRYQTTQSFSHKTGMDIGYYFFSEESGWNMNIHCSLPLSFDRQRMDYDSEPFQTSLTRHYTTFQPFVYFFLANHKTKGHTKQLLVNYNMAQQTPQIFNLITFPNTTDPLYIRLGNPDLKMMTNHLLRAEYTARIDSIDQMMRVQMDARIQRNAWAQGYTYDPVTGVRTYRSENIKSGNWKLSSTLNYRRALDGKKFFHVENELRLSVEKSTDLASVSGNTSTELSRVLTTYARWKPRLRYQKGNLNCTLRGGLMWQHLNRSLELTNVLPDNIYNISYGLYAQYKFPLNFTIDTDFDLYHRRGYTDPEMNDNRFYWNASLTKSLAKGRWVVKLRGYDLLGQVSNLKYHINAQGRTETWTNSMRRYVLLTANYHFSQKPKKK